MATQIDDIRYQPPATRVRVLETALLTLVLPVIGWTMHAHDPLFLDSAFSWLVIAPLLAGIRYGFVYGFSSALATVALMVLARYGWLAPGGQVSHVPVSYAVGVILIGMLAGEIADVWQRRLMQMSIINTAQATRLEEFVRQYHLLRVSHDQLAERLAATPHTLRDALLQLTERFLHLAPAEDVLERYAGEILSFLAVHGKVQQGALYRVMPNGSLSPSALDTFGGAPATVVPADHAMLRACLKQRHMICLKSEMLQDLPDDDATLLAVVPLIDIHERIWAVVTITEMPFIDYHRGQLHLLSVLGAHLGDLVHDACERLPVNQQGARHQFAAALIRWARYAQRYELHSLLVTLELPSHLPGEPRRNIAKLMFEQLRALDAGWTVTGANGPRRIHVLLPLTDEQGAQPYRQRITGLLHERYDIDASAGGYAFHYQLIDGTQSAGTLLRNLDHQETQHAVA